MAMVCAQLGLRFIAVMPEGVSNERSLMIAAYGGETVTSPKEQGIAGSMVMAEQLAAQHGLELAGLPLVPVGRLGRAEDIARSVAFLVADDADFITGATLSVNGGQHMY